MKHHWFVQWLQQQAGMATEETAEQYFKWAMLAYDMIRIGMEDVAFRYYDSKQQECGLLPRPNKVTEWNVTGILPDVKERLDNEDDPNEQERLHEIYTALNELLKYGMQQTALKFYLRSIAMYPHLGLKEPSMNVTEASCSDKHR